VVVSCPAKINLFLDVLCKRPDGYHEIETVMQAVDFYDTLAIEPAEGLELQVDPPVVPADDANLVIRAARLLQQHAGIRRGAKMRLAKSIPVGGGLGGGSSDAAGALAGLARIWQISPDREELVALAAQLGSDVAFFLYGGTAICRGRGEQVAPLRWSVPSCCYVLVCPDIAMPTREMYRHLDSRLTKPRVCSTVPVLAGEITSLASLTEGLYNAFELVAYEVQPTLRVIRSELAAAGAQAVVLSGSGSTVFGVCSGRGEAEEVARRLSYRVVVAEPERA
jgi:4-diphosphocytidyl-2-C-methyl-D-erythritol kinase